jgi:hypothetical protein
MKKKMFWARIGNRGTIERFCMERYKKIEGHTSRHYENISKESQARIKKYVNSVGSNNTDVYFAENGQIEIYWGF